MIKDFNELKAKIDKCIVSALEQTRRTVGGVLLEKVSDYYDEYDPIKYNRTFTLLDSIVSESKYSLDNGKVTKTKDGYEFKVGWDDTYLNFHYKKATGRMVLEWLDDKTHGGWQYDNNGDLFEHKFFTEAIEELGGEDGIQKLFKQNLRKLGVPIK
ncbi:MAG: hypothetical protein HFE79_13730 [Ruminiclostridium sp.]|nr:hypothetical protein [Ruminiclostridium sp.]